MDERPRRWHAAIMAVYAALFGAVANRISKDPELLAEAPPPRDRVLLGLASYQLSRLIAVDKVTSVFRQPFVEEGKGPLHPEGTREEATGSGRRLAIGQLLTCTLCMTAWAGAFNVYAYTLSPRLGRLFVLVVASTGMAQLLNPIFEALMKLPGVFEKQAGQQGGEQGGGQQGGQ